jgi:catechol 2,3-dioxygenase-like lactoylglutathione lyase family enzyme
MRPDAGNIALSSETSMQPRITVITLGVEDLERAVAFYRDGLGLPTNGIVGREFENGAVAFFDLQDGLKLAVWPRSSIAADAGLPLRAGGSLEFTLGHNVMSKAEVDAVMQQAAKAGATVVKTAADTFYGGYAGYFMDPDGHLWEAIYNPQLLPGAEAA